MAVSVSPRMGVTQWTAATDQFLREHLNDSLANIETRLKGFMQGTTRPGAALSLRGYLFFRTGANKFSYCDGTQWWDLIGGGTFGSPSSLLMTSTLSDGTSELASRSDHVHGLPGFGTPAAVGLSIASGSGDQVARSSHVHILGSGVITTPKLGAVTIDAAAIASGAVTDTKIQNNAVTEAKIANDTVATANIANSSVTEAKLANGAASGDKIGVVDASKFSTGVFAVGRIPSLPASRFTSGIFDPAVLPAIVPNDPSEYPIHPGQILFYVGVTAPDGYLLCDGAAVSRTTYSDLNSVLSAAGYPFGNGNGSSTFNLPNFTGRMPLGLRASGAGSNIGDTGGAFDHTHQGPTHSHSLDPANTASDSSSNHSHTNPSSGFGPGHHAHTVGVTASAFGSSRVSSSGTVGLVTRNDITHSHSHSHSNGSYFTTTDGYSFPERLHSHDVTGTSSSASPSYTAPERSHDHTHTTPSTDANGSHNHTSPNTLSAGGHNHNINIGSFSSASVGTGATGSANPPYVAVSAIVKT